MTEEFKHHDLYAMYVAQYAAVRARSPPPVAPVTRDLDEVFVEFCQFYSQLSNDHGVSPEDLQRRRAAILPLLRKQLA